MRTDVNRGWGLPRKRNSRFNALTSALSVDHPRSCIEPRCSRASDILRSRTGAVQAAIRASLLALIAALRGSPGNGVGQGREFSVTERQERGSCHPSLPDCSGERRPSRTLMLAGWLRTSLLLRRCHWVRKGKVSRSELSAKEDTLKIWRGFSASSSVPLSRMSKTFSPCTARWRQMKFWQYRTEWIP